MKRLVVSLMLMICFGCVVFAQPEDPRTRKLLDQAAKNGNGLRTEIIVNGNVHAQAVLIPQVDARRIFGKEIANNYAVVEVNVGNKSRDAALIIHGIFIDYRLWPFSGSTADEINAARSKDAYQTSAFPNQVASEEYRIVRGQLLDAQTDTFRNTFLRWLTLAGNLAGAFSFSADLSTSICPGAKKSAGDLRKSFLNPRVRNRSIGKKQTMISEPSLGTTLFERNP